MPAVPRFRRTEPTGPVTRAPEPIPVLATIRWHAGHATEEQALAVAWTRNAVEVTWTDPWGAERTDWVEASDVRRPGEPARAVENPDRPPRSSGRRPRW
ncbi:hypothetical protein [Kineosporia sp. R_H_3]|uniref:hypothetical protein n=1 Tax=Kineosporia sp. R_H_3 TaxID=1961848 RepID=UPI00117A6915|nr:hypothetical protein [Kineosporia sp. R_H_3]